MVRRVILFLYIFLLLLSGCSSILHWKANYPNEDKLGITFSNNEVGGSIRIPVNWYLRHSYNHFVYTDSQWTDPTDTTGVGVVNINAPFNLTSDLILKFAKKEYKKTGRTGQISSRYKDDSGHEWFEGEDGKYHVKGFVITSGHHAWILYAGYLLHPIYRNPNDFGLGILSIKTFKRMDDNNKHD